MVKMHLGDVITLLQKQRDQNPRAWAFVADLSDNHDILLLTHEPVAEAPLKFADGREEFFRKIDCIKK